jgi:hypothetical protein
MYNDDLYMVDIQLFRPAYFTSSRRSAEFPLYRDSAYEVTLDPDSIVEWLSSETFGVTILRIRSRLCSRLVGDDLTFGAASCIASP